MPDHETHCLHSLNRYGVRGDEIHTWLDEPSRIFGGSHRQLRHGYETINEAVAMFGTKYGAEVVRNIVTDHWIADSEEDRKRTMALVCTRCGANLGSNLKCDYCGLEHSKLNNQWGRYFGVSFDEFKEVCERINGLWKIHETFKDGTDTKIWEELMWLNYPDRKSVV